MELVGNSYRKVCITPPVDNRLGCPQDMQRIRYWLPSRYQQTYQLCNIMKNKGKIIISTEVIQSKNNNKNKLFFI